MKQPTIAANLIVKGTKDEADLLDVCLGNITDSIDAIFLNINHLKGHKVAKEVIAVAEKYHAIYFTTEWKDNFVDARNFILDKTPKEYDFILWLDTDDTVDKPEEIRKVVDVLSKSRHGVFIKYDYAHDEFGNTTVAHYVARIVRNNGTYRWKSSISDEGIAVHETLCEVVARPKAVCDDLKIIHHADEDRSYRSLQRNITMLEAMYDKQTENGKIDPRTLFYLATHYYDAGNYSKTKELLQDYMQLSGWGEERCEALVYLGKVYELEGKSDQSHHAYLLAIGEYQNSPRPYLELSELDFKRRRYQESADWIEKCLQLPKPATTMVQRPMESTFRAYMLAAQANVNLGGKKLDVAEEYIAKALKLRPLDPDAQKARDLIDNLVEQRENIRAAMRIARSFDDKTKIVPFLNSLPADIQDNPLVLTTRFANTEPKKWSKNSIAIYVGQGPLGIWGPWSLESGIGGSEEAVIKMSRELAKMGWSVTVFATPGERAGFDIYETDYSYTNVIWKQYYEFNPKDEYNVLVSWRNPSFFDVDIKANKKYLWLHDVMDKEEFTPERLANLDKVIFVGEHHANLYKGVIPEDKWLVSGNGIDPQDFIDADGKFERVPQRMIYMSSYDRGLKILLDNWDKIKEAVPKATLDIYYGWDSFDAGQSNNPERMAWKSEMVRLINSCKGVVDHGRIGHKQIVEEIAKADIFAYPCVFPEVYCISYVKAMAGGATTVTSDYAELSSYDGIQVHYEEGHVKEFIDKYIDRLIEVLAHSNEYRCRSIAADARYSYSWSNTAKGWDDEFSK
jgi:glycosyltransferase involved in cell wall biosynthesis